MTLSYSHCSYVVKILSKYHRWQRQGEGGTLKRAQNALRQLPAGTGVEWKGFALFGREEFVLCMPPMRRISSC